jgi:hypothetical protein
MPIKLELYKGPEKNGTELRLGKIVVYSEYLIDNELFPQIPSDINIRAEAKDLIRVSFADFGPKELVIRDIKNNEEKMRVSSDKTNQIIIRKDLSVEFNLPKDRGLARISLIDDDEFKKCVYN